MTLTSNPQSANTQLVFIHGPGAGGCSAAYENQLKHFAGSVAPDLPGHLQGAPCPDVARYTEWLRGWLWAQNLHKNLLLVGYTLGASIALQYALDYADEVSGLVISTVAAQPKVRAPGTYEMRLRAAADATAYEQEWIAFQRRAMHLVEPELRERLIDKHRQVGPMSQHHDFSVIDAFDVRDRLSTLKPKLLLLRGLQDHGNPPKYEQAIHQAVPGSEYMELDDAGHFPAVEIPIKVNAIIEDFIARL
ncbi:MAG: pimeloyl-ACP methyl ester carboxylesterase [Gammaproteobacteria bacterium]|jgi:pimeloyl-ACP methyl ester carboxylesterase